MNAVDLSVLKGKIEKGATNQGVIDVVEFLLDSVFALQAEVEALRAENVKLRDEVLDYVSLIRG